jgi:S1-C subfamily serine protease
MTGVVLAGIVAVVLGGTDWALIVPGAIKQVPRLEILKDGTDKPGVCSGVVLNASSGFLLTAAHCVEGDPKNLSITVNGRHAEIARVNRILDLAVLRFLVRKEEQMALAPETPPIGTEVAVVGFGFGIDKIAVQFGRVAQSLNRETGTLWINSEVLGGNSGGAVIDAQGRLVGMTSRVYYSTASSMGAAIPVEAIADFVEAYLPAKKKD